MLQRLSHHLVVFGLSVLPLALAMQARRFKE